MLRLAVLTAFFLFAFAVGQETCAEGAQCANDVGALLQSGVAMKPTPHSVTAGSMVLNQKDQNGDGKQEDMNGKHDVAGSRRRSRRRRRKSSGGGDAVAQDKDAWVAAHNMYRCMHGVGQVHWDENIAADALAWIQDNGYNHASISDTGLGENLAWQSVSWSASDAGKITKMWYDEVHDCNWPVTYIKSSIGHFTALIWEDVNAIGCAMSGEVAICRYKCKSGASPSMPNMRGYFAQKVHEPSVSKANCQAGSSSSSSSGGSSSSNSGGSALSGCGKNDNNYCFGYKPDGSRCWLTWDGQKDYVKDGDSGYSCEEWDGDDASDYCEDAKR